MNSKNSSKKGELTTFLVNYALRMLVTMIMQFYVTSVKHGSTSNLILTILTTNIYKVVMSNGMSHEPLFHLVI